MLARDFLPIEEHLLIQCGTALVANMVQPTSIDPALSKGKLKLHLR